MYNQRIQALRHSMTQAGINAVIIPQADPHMSEYLASHWQVRRWLSGFTGSAGTLVVTANEALLWTDSRYFLQASQELAPSDIRLMKDGLPDTPSVNAWLGEHLKPGDRLGINGMLMSLAEFDNLRNAMNLHHIKVDTSFDPIDELWTDRPSLPSDQIFVHEVKYAGESVADKLGRIMANVHAAGANAAFISALDEIAWALNIRCSDVKCNPVATAFLYIAPGATTLLIDPVKVDDQVRRYLAEAGVAVKPYAEVKAFAAALPQGIRVLIEPARTAVEMARLMGEHVVEGPSPIALLKACKNAVQVEGIREAMKRDGVALVGALMELEQLMATGEPVDELAVGALLLKHRSRSEMFFDESFGTIAGYGPHGAIVHYEADRDSSATLHPEGLLLIDSGAQYFDGTTDITRTIALGTPTAEERHDFTLVMKGHIALGTAIFPEGTCGAQLDALARQFLWKEGLAYLHGTGHGVGHFLNVHEGPQSIRLNYVPTPLMPGMITSNEPGLYREGVHGIRCENLVLTVDAMTTEFGRFYKFETLTMFPFDRSLFDTTIMADAEIEWVNNYHATVYATLAPALDANAAEWLRKKTAPIAR